eukprot:scaffold35621_cov150-Skeletonema_dohrnii-CCMP3373.AAC.1
MASVSTGTRVFWRRTGEAVILSHLSNLIESHASLVATVACDSSQEARDTRSQNQKIHPSIIGPTLLISVAATERVARG